MEENIRVIVVTDGDSSARRAVEVAAHKLNLRVISTSSGNPTKLTGREIADRVRQAEHDPVVVFVDDQGDKGIGVGERALAELSEQPGINLIGAIAVASFTDTLSGIEVQASIDREGNVIDGAVDKNGSATVYSHNVYGDTVGIINSLDIPVIIGLGDPGKQYHEDDLEHGAPRTTAALRELLRRSQQV